VPGGVMAHSSASKTRIGGWLVVLSWLIGVGPLTLGLEREQGHALALGLFGLACVVWSLAYRMLAASAKAARIASFAVPSLWGLSTILAGAVQLANGYWDWFPVASTSTVAATVTFAMIRGSPPSQGATP